MVICKCFSIDFFFGENVFLLMGWFVFRFIEGDFDTYVKEIQQPYVWGGEPELLMASHVLK